MGGQIYHKTDSVESVAKVKSRKMTGTEFLIKECDEKFWEDDLNPEGLEFAKHYYESNAYYGDYEAALVSSEPTLYHVRDTWDNYDKLSVYIDSAFKNGEKLKTKSGGSFGAKHP